MSYEQFCSKLAAHYSQRFALGIEAASFASEALAERAKIERKARRVAERPIKKTTVNGQQTTDFGSISLKKLRTSKSQNLRIG